MRIRYLFPLLLTFFTVIQVASGQNERLDISNDTYGNSHIPYVDGFVWLSGNKLIYRTPPSSGYNHKFVVDGVSGNVGIGAPLPVSRLDFGRDLLMDPVSGIPTITLWNDGSSYYGYGVSPGALNAVSVGKHNFYTLPTAGQPRKLACFIETKGMGIGVENLPPVPAGYTGVQLAVGGRIIAKEVKVTVAGLGDYVFAPAYRLRPLSEVDAFIKQNGHLPEVPSAAEVAKEGMNVGEMENTLLKKVEELTLYLIGQNKKLEVLQQENQQQARQIEHLQSRKKK
jgi:hypothetical protein